MRKVFLFSFILNALALHATDLFDTAKLQASTSSPLQIQEQIDRTQQKFNTAEKMFIPFYTGPLITGSANNVPPGYIDLQPYLYLTVNYAQFNSHRKSINTPDTYIINPLLLIQTGITKWMDFTVLPQGFFKFRQDQKSAQFGDLTAQLGFQLLRETPYQPSMRLILGEIFPTGNYQHLRPKKLGTDSTGSGTYITSFGLNLSKIFWWSLLHPISIRLSTQYNVQDVDAHVHSFNSYGGGHHTNGHVHVGNTLNADLGIEISITQRWVFATDFAYTYSNKSSFHGRQGTIAPGISAVNGLPSSDQFSIAPAVEYNVSKNGGFIGGVWFSVTGRNSPNFASLVLSYTQLF